MITQKDIHNILIKSDTQCKMELIEQCDYDVEKIKQFEGVLAEICNISTETISKTLAYMNQEL